MIIYSKTLQAKYNKIFFHINCLKVAMLGAVFLLIHSITITILFETIKSGVSLRRKTRSIPCRLDIKYRFAEPHDLHKAVFKNN